MRSDRAQPGKTEFGLHMLLRFGLTLTALALTAAGLLPLTCAAQARLSVEHGGLGLRQQGAPSAESPPGSFPRGWGSSLDAAFAPESALAPRQFTLAGEVRTA